MVGSPVTGRATPESGAGSTGNGLSPGSLPTLLAIVFVDMLGFAMIIPLIPFYAERFGASASVVGLLVASYAMAQLVGAPVLGGLSDRIGRKPVLMASLVGTSLGFLLFGLAGSLWLLFVARSLDGLTGGNVSVAQAYIADVSAPEKRARNFGFIGAAFGIGFIVGPALGGFLSRWGLSTPAFFAAALAAVNAAAVLLFLPESLPDRDGSGGGAGIPTTGSTTGRCRPPRPPGLRRALPGAKSGAGRTSGPGTGPGGSSGPASGTCSPS